MTSKISIYVITNTVNAKQYVGITKNLKRRWSNHKGMNKSSPLLHNAIKKYGIDAFVFTHIADAFDWECAQDVERMLIAEKNTKAPYGYNLTDGGDGTLGLPAPNKGRPMSEEAKQKSRLARIGKKTPEETKKKQSMALKGRKKSDDHKSAIGASQKGIPCPQRGRKGRVMSEETKQKISATRIAKFALIKAAKELA